MKMPSKVYLVALTLFAGGAMASPMQLEARYSSSEVVYLCHCQPGTPEAVGGIVGDYYTNIADSHNGQTPESESNEITDPTYYETPSWEGQTYGLYFPNSGVTFTSHINADAGSLNVGDYAGYGNNGHNFDCYKDNGNQLYSQTDAYGDTKRCEKNYYCRPVRLHFINFEGCEG